MRWCVWIFLLLCVDAKPCCRPIPSGIGAYIPQCTTDCEWVPRQCHGGIGYCWCVDKEGQRLSEMFQPWKTNKKCI